MHTLENRYIKISIAEEGAQLTSLVSHKQNIEFLWQADPDIWKWQAPVLFPIVGTLQDDSYHYRGAKYAMSRHGFAREKEFEVIDKTEKSITMCLTQDEETLLCYPFYFELIVTYELKGSQLIIKYKVKNTGDNDMYFSIGASPGFNCPLLEGENYKDYYIEFEKEESINRWFHENGLLTDLQSRVLENEKIIPLNRKKFDDGALLFKGIQSGKLQLRSGKTKNGLTLNFSGFPYLSLWARAGAKFLCISPLNGFSDHKNARTDLEHKEGIINLGANKTFECSYSIEPLNY